MPLTYPLYHFDFETFQQPIPEFKGVSPFQQIPFQYSLHIEYEDKPPEHKEFLGKEGLDPRESLVKKLIEDIPMNVTVLAFNASFEQMVFKSLAKQFDQHKEHLLNISNNIVDLAIPFQKRHYYLPEMRGKYSIKIVLPLLVPEMKRGVIYVDENQFSDQGKLLLQGKFEDLDNFVNSIFIILNGSYDEIIDDSDEDEVSASKTITKIDAIESDHIIVTVISEFEFFMHKKLTTEELLEWQDENDLFGFGLSLFLNSEFLVDKDGVEVHDVVEFDDLSISILNG
ncbi:MAG TPA: DUF2779 domain-containing protein [Piscirickettsiaceae bacterium]|nr:DUF2779 domain-containing protein [Piscirickettsiaceae bacterium]